VLRLALSAVFLLLVGLTGGCSSRPLLSELSHSSLVVRPNPSRAAEPVRITYTLGRRADVAVDLVGPDGKSYVLRERATRAPDTYQVRFDGTVGSDIGRRVVADGTYLIRVRAEDANGQRDERSLEVRVEDADTVPVRILDLQTDRTQFSPNGDGTDDDLRITYRLTKDAESTVYVTDEAGNYFAIDPWRERRATFVSHQWDGTTGGRLFGGKLLADGRYTLHVEARDGAGNTASATQPITIVGGGVPRLEITDVRFTPVSIVLGGTLDVRITVRNAGTTPIKTWGPPPGHTYSAPQERFASIRQPNDPTQTEYFERPGVWRVGVTWQNAPEPFPLRWGLAEPARDADGNYDWNAWSLPRGESVTVEGHIRVLIREPSREVRFWAGVIQEGVGFPSTRTGEQIVQVGWS
jgi:hypothetical protein